MAFAALISAYQEAEDGDDRLRALLPMAGRTLLEHQVRRAVRAGASHVVVLVERIPAALNAAMDRLRRDKLPVEIARDPADAASRLHPAEDVLLVADGLVASHACFERMAASEAPSLLVVEDISENAEFERIDAQWRWAGLALTDPDTMRETAEMVGEWDIQSTLLRRIVQRGARYHAMGDVELASERVTLHDRAESTRSAGRDMLGGERSRDESWPERFLYPPIITMLGPLALDRAVDPFWMRLGGVALTVLAALAFWSGWLWTGLVPLLIGGLAASLAHRIERAHLRDRSASWESRFGRSLALGMAVAAIGFFFASQSDDSGYLVAAGAAIAMLLLCERELSVVRRMGEGLGALRPWILSIDGAVWMLFLLALLGWWRWWPLAIAIHGTISLLLMQNVLREALRRGGS